MSSIFIEKKNMPSVGMGKKKVCGIYHKGLYLG